MSKDIFPQTPADLAAARKKLAPHIHLSAIPIEIVKIHRGSKRLRGRRLPAVPQRRWTEIARFGANTMQLMEGKR